jgi:hypothetical protein
MIIHIYVLIDPRSMSVRYVGQTNNPKERLRAHVSPHIYMKTYNKKAIWTEELKAARLKPIMQVLFTCHPDQANMWEHYFFKLFTATIFRETFQYNITYGESNKIHNRQSAV